MNFVTSRRSTVNYAEMTPVSPSHTVLQVASSDRSRTSRSNRRPRKRERSLGNFETDRTAIVDRSSPGPSSGDQRTPVDVEIRVASPTGWAVTETNLARQNIEEAGETPCRRQPSPRRPRTAWSDDSVTKSDADFVSPVESPTFPQKGSTYVNCGFLAASDDDGEEDRSVGGMLAQLQRKIETAESQLATWNDVRATAERDAVEARQVHRKRFNFDAICPHQRRCRRPSSSSSSVVVVCRSRGPSSSSSSVVVVCRSRRRRPSSLSS